MRIAAASCLCFTPANPATGVFQLHVLRNLVVIHGLALKACDQGLAVISCVSKNVDGNPSDSCRLSAAGNVQRSSVHTAVALAEMW